MSEKLILYCDCEHDDTEALNAWQRREPVYRPNGEPVGQEIRGEALLVLGAFSLGRGREDRRITECHFFDNRQTASDFLNRVWPEYLYEV
jgi:hypothetical protein